MYKIGDEPIAEPTDVVHFKIDMLSAIGESDKGL